MATKKDMRLKGTNPLAYVGVNAYSPPNIAEYTRPPTAADRKNFDIGSIWIDTSPVAPSNPDVWILVKFSGATATWINLSSFNVNGTNGQVLIGGGTEALWANITTASGLVVVNEGVNTLDLDLSGTIADIFQTDVAFAQPVGGVLEIAGGTSITTTGAGGVVTIDVDEDVLTTFLGDVGSATPVANTIYLEGGANVTTNAAGAVVTFTATGGGGGGSANASFLAHQVADGGAPSGGLKLGAAVVMTEIYDIGGNFTVGDGAGVSAKFTAPQDGKYLLQMEVKFTTPTATTNLNRFIEIQTSNRTYRTTDRKVVNAATIGYFDSMSCSVIADMDALDTAEFSTDDIDVFSTIQGDVAVTGEYQTFVSGSLEESDVFGFTEHAPLVGDATSGIGELPLGTDGQVIIGATGASPLFANITAGANITINEGANSLEIVSTGGGLGSSVVSFLAYQSTNESTGLPADGRLGEDVILTEVYDIGAGFYEGDGAGTPASFTAPQTGKYQLNLSVTTGSWEVAIITSKRTYYSLAQRPGTGTLSSTQRITVVADMDATDVAFFAFRRDFNGAIGNKTSGTYTGAYQTYVSGTLV